MAIPLLLAQKQQSELVQLKQLNKQVDFLLQTLNPGQSNKQNKQKKQKNKTSQVPKKQKPNQAPKSKASKANSSSSSSSSSSNSEQKVVLKHVTTRSEPSEELLALEGTSPSLPMYNIIYDKTHMCPFTHIRIVFMLLNFVYMYLIWLIGSTDNERRQKQLALDSKLFSSHFVRVPSHYYQEELSFRRDCLGDLFKSLYINTHSYFFLSQSLCEWYMCCVWYLSLTVCLSHYMFHLMMIIIYIYILHRCSS